MRKTTDPRVEARRRLAALQGRRLARGLQDLPVGEALELARLFITGFIEELFRRDDVEAGAVLDLAHVPMDLVLEHQRTKKSNKHIKS